MAKQELTQVTLESGREVTLGPLMWMAYPAVMDEAFRVFVDRMKDLQAVGGDNKEFMVAALYSMIGDPGRWLNTATGTLGTWLAWGSIREPQLALGKDGRPDLRDWTAEEVTEVLTHVQKLTDFAKIAERLKNSLAPVATQLGTLPVGTGVDETNEGSTSTNGPKG